MGDTPNHMCQNTSGFYLSESAVKDLSNPNLTAKHSNQQWWKFPMRMPSKKKQPFHLNQPISRLPLWRIIDLDWNSTFNLCLHQALQTMKGNSWTLRLFQVQHQQWFTLQSWFHITGKRVKKDIDRDLAMSIIEPVLVVCPELDVLGWWLHQKRTAHLGVQ